MHGFSHVAGHAMSGHIIRERRYQDRRPASSVCNARPGPEACASPGAQNPPTVISRTQAGPHLHRRDNSADETGQSSLPSLPPWRNRTKTATVGLRACAKKMISTDRKDRCRWVLIRLSLACAPGAFLAGVLSLGVRRTPAKDSATTVCFW
jgi:hypothetical protein